MQKSLLEIYALAVCFLSVMCFTVALGNVAWNVVVFANPEMSLDNATWAQHQSDEKYREYLISINYGTEESPYLPPEGPALSQEREQSWTNALRGITRDAWPEILKWTISLALYAILFLIHWKMAAVARRSAS
jgi:hypothetical protein